MGEPDIARSACFRPMGNRSVCVPPGRAVAHFEPEVSCSGNHHPWRRWRTRAPGCGCRPLSRTPSARIRRASCWGGESLRASTQMIVIAHVLTATTGINRPRLDMTNERIWQDPFSPESDAGPNMAMPVTTIGKNASF